MLNKSYRKMIMRKVILDNVHGDGHYNERVSHVMSVLRDFNARIDDIVIDKASNESPESEQLVKISLDIICRAVDWAMIQENLIQYQYQAAKYFTDITTK